MHLIVVLKPDIQETLEERTECPATCASPAACPGLANCTAGPAISKLANGQEPAAFRQELLTPALSDDAEPQSQNFTSTRNACKLCTPLGVCLAFRGVEGCIPFLHGSQGCSTYIRRYLISHFREPIDIASSNFHEESAIFGGSKNFTQGVLNVIRQYQPQLIGVATTCLAETIGEDMARLQHELRGQHGGAAAPIVHVSNASYRGTLLTASILRCGNWWSNWPPPAKKTKRSPTSSNKNMAFLIYKKYGNAETVRYEKLQPLRLGGRHGLVAKHVKTLTGDQPRSWKLGTSSLLKLAAAGAVDELTVLFDVTGKDATNVCLYELSRIHGSCADTSTQLALDFAVVVDQEIGDGAATYAMSFEIPVPEKPRLLGETLALSGGPGGGDWQWAGTSLQLGATVVQAQHGHGIGEPCPSCTCGRRKAGNK